MDEDIYSSEISDSSKSRITEHLERPQMLLSSDAILRIVNKAAHYIRKRDEKRFDKAMFELATVANIIRDNTEQKSLVINVESAVNFLDKLKALRSEQFIIYNDGLDHQRGRLAVVLRTLIGLVADQMNLASEYLNPQPTLTIPFEEATHEQPTAESDAFHSAVVYLYQLLEQVKVYTPGAYEKLSQAVQQLQETAHIQRHKVEARVHTYYESCCEILALKGIQALHMVHPYIHSAYSAALPVATIVASQAKPFLHPLLTAALSILRALQKNLPFSGTALQLQYLLAQLYLAIELLRLYCAISDSNEAVSRVLAEMPLLSAIQGTAAAVVVATPQAVGELVTTAPSAVGSVVVETTDLARDVVSSVPDVVQDVVSVPTGLMTTFSTYPNHTDRSNKTASVAKEGVQRVTAVPTTLVAGVLGSVRDTVSIATQPEERVRHGEGEGEGEGEGKVQKESTAANTSATDGAVQEGIHRVSAVPSTLITGVLGSIHNTASTAVSKPKGGATTPPPSPN